MHACMQSCGMENTVPSEELISASSHDAAVSGKEPLQVRIPRDVKRRFKARAALLGLEPNELFVTIWEDYERSNR